MKLQDIIRPAVQRMTPYIPGEQPQTEDWIKLNTNENPYPPSPKVVEAIDQVAKSGRLKVYPDPISTKFRNAAAKVLNVDPDWILPGNGSDEVLTMSIRAIVEPGELTAFPYPSYILYGTLAEIQGTEFQHLPLDEQWNFIEPETSKVVQSSKLVWVPNPNSPSGHCWDDEQLLKLIPPKGLLIWDQAYDDFADLPVMARPILEESSRRIMISRTLSKSYSLAGLRFGYAVAHPDFIQALLKVKDSYNCDALSLAAATAAMEDQQYVQNNIEKIKQTRKRCTTALQELGFDVLPSQANFLWCEHKTESHQKLYEGLKAAKILVRFMKFPKCGIQANEMLDGLRITIGTDQEMDALLAALKKLL